ncbi:MAG: Gfo/Idh/MocA family oxidoreductase [Chloroflexota bacterium]
MASPIRIGLVGASRILPLHLRGYAELRRRGFDDFRITAICSRDPQRALTFRKRGEGPEPAPVTFTAPHSYVSDFQDDVLPETYTDVRAMLDAGVVDAVDITTEVGLHHTQALQAIEAGVHALVEKPMAVSVRAAHTMVNAAKQRGVVLAVCENARFHPVMRRAGWALERGDLGKPQMVTWWVLGVPEWSPDRFVGNSPWRHQKLIGAGGASLDIGPHIFHRLRMLCGEVSEVTALAAVIEPERYLRATDGEIMDRVACDADDTFMASASFESGALGQLAWSFAGHGGQTTGPQPLFYGSKGVLRADRIQLDGSEQEPLNDYFDRHVTAAERQALFPNGLEDAFGLLIGDWLSAIRAGREAATSGVEGLHDLAASFAIVESSQARRAVTLAEVLDGRVDAYQAPLNAHYGLS